MFCSWSSVLLLQYVSTCFCGLPRFRLPSGVQYNAVLVMELLSLLITCPIHFQRLFTNIVPMISYWHWFRRSSLDILFVQKMRRILLKLLVWKTDNLLRSTIVILQHSDPYNREDSTQLCYSFSLVFLLYCDDFHTLLSDLNIFLALFNLFMMSFPAPPSFLIVLPRYVNVSVMGESFPSTRIGVGLLMFRVMTSVLVWLIVSPTWLAKVFRRFVFSCKWWWVCDKRARSSAKSRSSNVDEMFHYIPLGASFVVFSHYPVNDDIETAQTRCCFALHCKWNCCRNFLWAQLFLFEYDLSIRHEIFRLILSKAFWKSKKLM